MKEIPMKTNKTMLCVLGSMLLSMPSFKGPR